MNIEKWLTTQEALIAAAKADPRKVRLWAGKGMTGLIRDGLPEFPHAVRTIRRLHTLNPTLAQMLMDDVCAGR